MRTCTTINCLGGFIFGSALLFGCETSSTTPSTAVSSTSTSTHTAASEQISLGAMVYGTRCASCHGSSGQGTGRAPLLVGDGALPLMPRDGSGRDSHFRTAMDVAVFATQTMPPNEAVRSVMSERDYWAVLAFALSANGVELTSPVGPDNASQIVLHP